MLSFVYQLFMFFIKQRVTSFKWGLDMLKRRVINFRIANYWQITKKTEVTNDRHS
jgi:hypothetical protein